MEMTYDTKLRVLKDLMSRGWDMEAACRAVASRHRELALDLKSEVAYLLCCAIDMSSLPRI